MSKKIYVLDTNVLLHNANAIYEFGNSNVVIPFIVLEEIDKFKSRLDNTGFNARTFIKILDELRKKGSIITGARIFKGKGLLTVKDVDSNFKTNLSLAVPDNKIIAVALIEQFNNQDKKIIVVSNDINIRIKCDAVGVGSQNYSESKIITKRNQLYSGFTTHLVDDQVIERFYAGEGIILDKEEINLYPNQFVMLISNSNEKKTGLARFVNPITPLKKVIDYKKGLWGVVPRNKEQTFLMNLLMDPSIQIVTSTGGAGTGKTLISIAASLEQVIGEKPLYQKLVVSRPMIPVGGKDIGFLPGSKEEKMMPWLASISDNLEFLLGNDKNMFDEYIEKGIIELEALSFIRGRSISNAIIIFDECQNLNAHEIRTIVTRVGENTKIILTGDIGQIDNVYINEFNNGLSHAIEKLKGESIYGHITLTKGERSKVATIGAKLL